MSEEIKVSEEAHKLTLELLELLNFDTTHPRVMLEDIPSFDNQIQLLLNQQIQLACLNWRHRDAVLQTKIAALEAALGGILTRYLNLVLSGDCGNWNPEKEAEVIAATAALNSTKGEK